jgi:hypothetical protein
MTFLLLPLISNNIPALATRVFAGMNCVEYKVEMSDRTKGVGVLVEKDSSLRGNDVSIVLE